MPKVSVLIPTYNYAHLIDDTVQSVLNQSFSDFELIIIDDASKDNTDEVVQKYLTDPRVSYHVNQKNLGLVGNWNKCLSMASGEYIKILCADDKLRADYLEKFVDVFEKYPNVSLVVCNKQMYGKSSVIVELPLKGLHSGIDVIYNTLNTYGWLGEPSCVMFRKSNLSVGEFKKNTTWLPDWEMWIRQLSVGDCYLIPEPLAYVMNHQNQLTKKVMKYFINYFEEYDMCRDIEAGRGYNIDLSGIDMKKIIRKRAENCAVAMYKVLPRIYKKEERKIFFKALGISLKEGVVFSPLARIFSKKQKAKPILTMREGKPIA